MFLDEFEGDANISVAIKSGSTACSLVDDWLKLMEEIASQHFPHLILLNSTKIASAGNHSLAEISHMTRSTKLFLVWSLGSSCLCK